MQKRLLFLEDLYEFYSNNSIHTFNASKDNDGKPLYVQSHGFVNFSNSSKEGLLFADLKACHCGENLNKSYIAKEVMEDAIPSLGDRPILGFLHQVNDQWEFYGHNMEIDKDGNIEYQEIPVGHFSLSCNPKLIYDKDEGKDYVHAQGIIYEDYTHAAEILKREGECAVSVELAIRDLNYSSEDGLLHINSFYFSGCTILGKDDNGKSVMPGMAGSKVTISDFSEENNSIFSKLTEEKLLQTLDKINDTLSKFEIDNLQGKEEKARMEEFLQKMLSKYNITEDQITFSIEGLNEGEITTLFEEHFAQNNNPSQDFALSSQFVDELMDSLSSEKFKTEYGTYSKYCYADHDTEVSEVYAFSREDWKLYGFTYVINGDSVKVDFNTQKRKKYAIVDFQDSEPEDGSLYNLVQPVIEAAISYTTETVKTEFETEMQSLKDLYSDYDELKTFKEQKDADDMNARKEGILTDDSYFDVKDLPSFKNLMEHMEDYSLEEIEKAADDILLDYTKKANIESAKASSTFSSTASKRVSIQSHEGNKTPRPYGTLFDEYELKQ